LPPRALALIAGVAVAIIAVAVVLITQLGGGSSAPANQGSTAPAPAAAAVRHHRTSTSGLNRSSVTVAVLNGTTTPGLAKQVSDQLVRGGFKGGSTANAATQQLFQTQVAYASGQRQAAVEIARLLGPPSAFVTPIDAGTRALAPAANVVVTVGTDRATKH